MIIKKIVETFTPYQNDVCEYRPSVLMTVFVVIMYLLLETVGNFLLFCFITFEKYGMDSQKRTATNQLLSSICEVVIVFNIIFMTINIFNMHGIQSKRNTISKNNSIAIITL